MGLWGSYGVRGLARNSQGFTWFAVFSGIVGVGSAGLRAPGFARDGARLAAA